MVSLILSSRRGGSPLLPYLPGFRDDFNRPDGPLIATSNGRLWMTSEKDPIAERADVVIQGNAAVVTVPAGVTGNVVKKVDTGSANGVYSATIRTIGNQAGGLVVRGESMTECIDFSLRVSAGTLRPAFYARVGSARTLLGTSPVGTVLHDADLIQILLDGPNIIAYQNQVPILGIQTTVHQTKTGAGIYGYAAGPGIAYDDLRFDA